MEQPHSSSNALRRTRVCPDIDWIALSISPLLWLAPTRECSTTYRPLPSDTFLNARHLQRSTARLAPGRSSRPYLREVTQLRAKSPSPFWRCRYLSSSGAKLHSWSFWTFFPWPRGQPLSSKGHLRDPRTPSPCAHRSYSFLENLFGAASGSHGIKRSVCTNCEKANESFRAGRVPLWMVLEDPGPSSPFWNRSRSRPPAPPRCFPPPARTPISTLLPCCHCSVLRCGPRSTRGSPRPVKTRVRSNTTETNLPLPVVLDGCTVRANHPYSSLLW